MELRRGDHILWTRNDGFGLFNSQTTEVAAVKDRRVTFHLKMGACSR